jgi:hypothetical protein
MYTSKSCIKLTTRCDWMNITHMTPYFSTRMRVAPNTFTCYYSTTSTNTHPSFLYRAAQILCVLCICFYIGWRWVVHIYINFIIYTHTCHFAWGIRIGVYYIMRTHLHKKNIRSVCEWNTLQNHAQHWRHVVTEWTSSTWPYTSAHAWGRPQTPLDATTVLVTTMLNYHCVCVSGSLCLCVCKHAQVQWTDEHHPLDPILQHTHESGPRRLPILLKYY